jgi:hypothetical protein
MKKTYICKNNHEGIGCFGWEDPPLPSPEGDETVRISLPGSYVLAGTVPSLPLRGPEGGRDSEDFITWIVRVGWEGPLLPSPWWGGGRDSENFIT